MSIINALLGVVLCFFGRNLFWVFVAVAGFLVGVQLADVVLADQSQMVRLVIAIAAGVLGALLAMLVQRVGFALGGLYAGGYLALSAASAAGDNSHHLLWFSIGGVIGGILAVVLMDWAIIVLSSLVGAAAVVASLALSSALSTLLFLVLAVAGITIQGNRLRSHAAAEEQPS